MSDLAAIFIDSLHPARLARFWAAALTGYEIRAYDDAEIERLAALGFTPDTDPSVALDGPGPTFFFQITTLEKTQRNRVHIDITGASRADEVSRLVGLGATVREERDNLTVMSDPEDNEFCVLDP
jgi:hypothetical protein